MAGYNLFSTSTLGMMAQSYSLNVIGNNVANMTTGGFKGTEVRFASLVSRPLFEQSDLGGVKPYDVYSVDKQGAVVATPRVLDISIAGRGMFALNTELDGSGEALYTRDGSFELRVGDPISLTDDDGNAFTSNEMYLVDKNGYYVMGAERQTDGSFAIPGTLGGIRLDTYAFTNEFEPSESASIRLNLPAGADAGDDVQYNISLVDSEGVLQTPELLFTKADGNNQWYLTSSALTQVAQVSTVTLAGTPEAGDVYSVRIGATTVTYTATGAETGIDEIATNLAAAVNGNGTLGALVTAAGTAGGLITLTANTAGDPFTATANAVDGGVTDDSSASVALTTAVGPLVTFSSSGVFDGTSPQTLDFTFTGGATGTLSLDLDDMTQYDAPFTVFSYTRDGFASADLQSYSFDEKGQVIGRFGDGTSRALYKLPLAQFSNFNGLEARNGQVYAESELSGEVRMVEANANGFGTFLPGTREMANVDLEVEFSRMIITQNAYNSSATVFKTVDEMTEIARDLKR
jgi:flagellar hook protein FlgE